MKKYNIKKVLLCVLLSIMMVATLGVLCSCDEPEPPSLPTPPPTNEVTLTINKNRTDLIIGQYEKLKATLENSKENITWSSTNPQVATVSNTGMVTGVSVGTSKIIARASDLSAECVVSVGLGNYVPEIQMESFSGDSVSIATVDTVNLRGEIKFNGKSYSDAYFSYQLSDASAGEIVNGIFTPFKRGEVQITISAIWRGLDSNTLPTLTKTVTINANKNITFFVNGSEPSDIELYTRSNWGNKTFTVSVPFKPTAYVDGQEVECEISSLSTEKIVQWNTQTLSAVKKGETTLKLSCVDGGREYSTRIKVNVLRPVVDFGETFTGLSLIDGNIDVEKLFGEGAVLLDAYQNGAPLEVRNNCVIGIKTQRTGLTTTEVTVYTEDVGYNVTLKGYTKIIRTKEDLKIFEVRTSSPFYNETTDTVTIDGYFYLANDITEKGDTITHSNSYVELRTSNYEYPNGFNGVLEGNGHKITFESGVHGFFGNLLGNSVVRNVAFTDVTVSTSSSFEQMSGAGVVMAHEISARYGATGSFENVYVGIKTGVQIGIFGARPAWYDIRNVVVEYSEEVRESSRGARGSLFCEDNYKTERKDNEKEDLDNVFIISSRGTPVEYSWSGGYRAYAKNQIIDDKYQGVAFQYSSVYQCATRQELKQTITQYGCNLKNFNSNCWDCSSGTPVWKGLA